MSEYNRYKVLIQKAKDAGDTYEVEEVKVIENFLFCRTGDGSLVLELRKGIERDLRNQLIDLFG